MGTTLEDEVKSKIGELIETLKAFSTDDHLREAAAKIAIERFIWAIEDEFKAEFDVMAFVKHISEGDELP